MGRKPIELDLKELEFLSGLHCSNVDLAEHFAVDEKTIRNKLKVEPYRSVWLRARAEGRIVVRQMQLKAAQAGNPAMLIWLGKNLLDQTDVSRVDVRRLHENINELIDCFLAVGKTYVPADRWEDYRAALRRHAEATLARAEG
jgi:hypothetical protein